MQNQLPKQARKGGRKRWDPTQAQRELVAIASANSYSRERLANVFGISLTTLEKKFAFELANGATLLDGAAYKTIADAIKAGDVKAAIKHLEQRAWPKDRGAWRANAANAQGSPYGEGGSSDLPPLTLSINFRPADPSKKPDLLNEAVFTPMRPTEMDKAETIDAKPSSEPEPHQPTYEAGVAPSYVSSGRKDVRRDKAGNKVDMSHDPADPAFADGPPGKKHWMG